MTVTVIDHPIVQRDLTVLRNVHTSHQHFRSALRGLSRLVIYEALRDLPATSTTVSTPMGEASGVAIGDPPLLTPILRAGLGMLDAALDLVPEALVGFVGLRRNEETFEAERYLDTVPEDLAQQTVLILDPMLATGGSLVHTAQRLRDVNAGRLLAACVLAAPEGIDAVDRSGLDIEVTTAAIDTHLDDRAFIVPGLGDAGDRQYGTA